MTKKKRYSRGIQFFYLQSEIQQTSRADVTKVPPKLNNVNHRITGGFLPFCSLSLWLKGWSCNQNETCVPTWLLSWGLKKKTKKKPGAHLSKAFVVWGVLCIFLCLCFWGVLNCQNWCGLPVIAYDESCLKSSASIQCMTYSELRLGPLTNKNKL